ncbi:MAG: glycosyltransferase, partial [Colwellia sp.]|nr:glycosyltransferase [Colwellia sp.]
MIDNINTPPTKVSTLLVMAGGTGGHIFPGLAVADKLKSEGWHIHWLGTADRMEADIIPKHGYKISFINISGIRHKNLLAWLQLPFKLVNSLLQAFSVINTVKPDAVLGMGGYASAP